MQNERDVESNGRKTNEDNGRFVNAQSQQTMEYHLKAAHVLYCDEVRALKLQVQALKKKLKENVSRELKCSQCESIKKLLHQQEMAFGEKLQEKNQIICDLRYKLELNELRTSDGAFGPTNHWCKKRRLLSRKDCIKLKENQALDPSSDDDVKILNIKPDCTTSPYNHEKKSTKLMKSDLDEQYAKNRLKSANFVFVPETLVEDMGRKSFNAGNCNNKVVVPETLPMTLDFSDTESPVFNNCSARTIANHAAVDEKSVAGCSPNNSAGNVLCNRMINEILGANNVSDDQPQSESHEKDMRDAIPIRSTCKLVSEDLDVSMDEFQNEPTKKGKISKSACNFEHQISKLKTGNNFLNKVTTTKKVRTPSPSSKYKLRFSPARLGHRKPKYKQTTLTQKTSGAWQENGIDEKIADYDLNKAIQQSLHDHEVSSLVLRKSHIESIQQEKMIAVEPGLNDDSDSLHDSNNSCLDATYVSSQILMKALFPKHDLATSVATKSSSIKEKKVENSDNDSPDSEDLIQQMPNQPSSKNERNLKNSASIPLHEDDNCFDDFDIVPNNNNSSPNYKYKEPAVRKQNERRKLDGYQCRECAAYLESMGLGEEEKKKRLKECSRHRGKYALPATPEHFWSVDFPSTQECKERGVMNPTQYKPLRRRRRHRK